MNKREVLADYDSSSIVAKLPDSNLVFNLLKIATNESVRKHDVTFTSTGGSDGETGGWPVQVRLSGRKINGFNMAAAYTPYPIPSRWV